MLWDSDIFTLNKETIGQKCHKFTVFRRYRWAIKPDILQKLNAQLTLLLLRSLKLLLSRCSKIQVI